MSSTLMLWVVLAVLAFWAVGAYNRLVVYRGHIRTAFMALDPQWSAQAALARSCMPQATQALAEGPGRVMDGADALWAGLAGAANQLDVSLSAMRQRPLDPQAAAALATAHQVLSMAWRRVQDEAHDLAGAPLPQSVQLQWQQQLSLAEVAADAFNQAVSRYNEAIEQFPALLLARTFDFQPVRGL